MTSSIAAPLVQPQQLPMLRPLSEVLPPAARPARRSPPPRAAPVRADPAAPAVAARLLRAAVELLDGRRPPAQLAEVLRPDLLNHLVALHEVVGPLRPRAGKVIARQQSATTLEAVALVTLNTGVRALAARFECSPCERPGAEGRWRCTALQFRLTTGDVTARRRPVSACRS